MPSAKYLGVTLLGPAKETPQREAAKRLKYLIRVGGKLGVLGIDPSSKGAATMWWHVANPGTWDPTQESTGLGLVWATSLCKRAILTNGYAADWRPGDKVLCPACRERI